MEISTMTKTSDRNNLQVVADQLASDSASVTPEMLDADEEEFKKLCRDLPGSNGASASGIVALKVDKLPGGASGKNEFFRTHPDFRPVIAMIGEELGLERQYFAVHPTMQQALHGIGIESANYRLYLTITARGAFRLVPILIDSDNDYIRTKEIGLIKSIDSWHRLYHDRDNRNFKVYPAPLGRFDDPVWPELSPAKIIRLAFRDKGQLIDSTEHPAFLRWAARDYEDDKPRK
jgi:hypothetical protein